MAVLGNSVKGNVNDRESGKVLSVNQVHDIHRVLLMMLEDIDSICRKHGLTYILIG